ncbi:hypothetical protein DPX16_12925 [Anabarilius grahami]|uniref:Uncharacterized protein n=1 Tax=Anabarilius grahami TaxID=495550 RepID=A0A3N0XDG5_ANAGA|nr:hypothetical protein DPX16_12925 [Anabarilius grahami]
MHPCSVPLIRTIPARLVNTTKSPPLITKPEKLEFRLPSVRNHDLRYNVSKERDIRQTTTPLHPSAKNAGSFLCEHFSFDAIHLNAIHLNAMHAVSNVSICPLKSVTTTNCSQVETPMRMTSMQMSFPETVSDSLCRNSLVMQTDCFSSCPGGWSQTILEVKMLDVEVLCWCGYT